MQHGPETPPTTLNTSPTDAGTSAGAPSDAGALGLNDPGTESQVGDKGSADQTLAGDQALDGGPIEGELESSGESFFQTWAKGQERPLGPSMLFLVGVLLALLIMMRSLRKSSSRRKLQTRTMGQPSERLTKINARASATMDPAQRAMVDAENLARRLGAVLDNKAARIEILLEEANERITQLEQSVRQSPRPVSTERMKSAPSVPPEALDRARLDQDRAERQWAEERPVAEERETGVEPSEPTYRIDRGFKTQALPESPNPLTFPEQVDELAVQGLDARQIAEKLGRHIGEVELVLNLRKKAT